MKSLLSLLLTAILLPSLCCLHAQDPLNRLPDPQDILLPDNWKGDQAPEFARALSENQRKELLHHIATASQHIGSGNVVEAIEALSAAESLAPDFHVIYNLRGAAYTKTRDFKAAEKNFQQAIALDPQAGHQPKFNLIELLFVQRKFTEAYQSFNTLLTEYPELPELMRHLVQYKMIICKLQLGEIDAASTIRDENFHYLQDTPAYYMTQAAFAFQKEVPAEAQLWVNRATRIYKKHKVDTYLDSLLEVGWVNTLVAHYGDPENAPMSDAGE